MLFRECVGGENTQAMTAEFQSMSSRRESKSSVRGALILLSGSFCCNLSGTTDIIPPHYLGRIFLLCKLF